MLIGVPGSGKSTWASNQAWASDCIYVSTDEFVEKYAIEQGKSYNDVFSDYMPTAVRLMAEQVVEACKLNMDIIWDQTSTTIESRKKKFNMLPEYAAIAVVFATPEQEELVRRLNNRKDKFIPLNIVQSMIANWQEPSKEEGFKEIWYN
jgi:predicted kinase